MDNGLCWMIPASGSDGGRSAPVEVFMDGQRSNGKEAGQMALAWWQGVGRIQHSCPVMGYVYA
jgi:hypothetical protein